MTLDLTTEPLGTGTRRRAGLPARPLADRARDSGDDAARRSTPRCSASSTRTCSAATTAGRRCSVPTGDRFAWEPDSTYIRNPPFFDGITLQPAPLQRHHRRARARAARRQHHDRSHLAGRLDQEGQPGRQVPDRARRAAGRLQLLRRAPRQPRSDDARHVRQHPAAQPARARHRRRLDDLPARRRGDDDLRRGDEIQGRRRAAASSSPARNTARARRATGRRRARCCSACARSSPRASSASTAATSSTWACCRCSSSRRDRRVARADRPRAVRDRRHRRRADARRHASPCARVGDDEPIEFQAIARIDTPEELVAFRHGGILPYVLRQLVGEEHRTKARLRTRLELEIGPSDVVVSCLT